MSYRDNAESVHKVEFDEGAITLCGKAFTMDAHTFEYSLEWTILEAAKVTCDACLIAMKKQKRANHTKSIMDIEQISSDANNPTKYANYRDACIFIDALKKRYPERLAMCKNFSEGTVNCTFTEESGKGSHVNVFAPGTRRYYIYIENVSKEEYTLIDI